MYAWKYEIVWTCESFCSVHTLREFLVEFGFRHGLLSTRITLKIKAHYTAIPFNAHLFPMINSQTINK